MSTPVLMVGLDVKTPYGLCVVEEIRVEGRGLGESIICTPRSWKLAQGAIPKFFLNRKDVTPEHAVGDRVVSPYGGDGKIVSIRATAEGGTHYVVTLDNWKLAGNPGLSPVQYLNRNSIEKDSKEWVETLARASAHKNNANALFNQAKIAEARREYLETLQCLQHLGSDNKVKDFVRAQAFELIVPCHNNLSLCAFKLNSFAESKAYGNNAFMLIEKMEEQIASPTGSPVWRLMMENGVTKEKMSVEWKKKSLSLMVKSELALKEYDEAVTHAEAAYNISSLDLSQSGKKASAELKLLWDKAKEGKQKEESKAAKTWSKAFSKSTKEYKKQDEEKAEQKAAAEKAKKAGKATDASPKKGGTISDPFGIGNPLASVLSAGGGKKSSKKVSYSKGDDDDDDDDEEGDGGGTVSTYLFSGLFIIGLFGMASWIFMPKRGVGGRGWFR